MTEDEWKEWKERYTILSESYLMVLGRLYLAEQAYTGLSNALKKANEELAARGAESVAVPTKEQIGVYL